MEGLLVDNNMLVEWFNEYVDMNNPKITLMGYSYRSSDVLKISKERYDFEFNQWLEMEIDLGKLLQDDLGNIYEPF
jgi:hypothetical protein